MRAAFGLFRIRLRLLRQPLTKTPGWKVSRRALLSPSNRTTYSSFSFEMLHRSLQDPAPFVLLQPRPLGLSIACLLQKDCWDPCDSSHFSLFADFGFVLRMPLALGPFVPASLPSLQLAVAGSPPALTSASPGRRNSEQFVPITPKVSRTSWRMLENRL